MLNVNEVRKHVLKTGSLTSAIGTGTVYNGQYNRYAKKRELNIIITASGSDKLMIRQVPLFDNEDLDMMKKDTMVNKYLHIGCVTISIEPLLHQRYIENFGSNITGHCALVDSTFRNLSESIISLHKYDLSRGRADYVSYPNHCLSLTDPHIQKRLSILLGINGLNVDPGTELFSLCIGYIVSAVSTLNPTKSIGMKNIPIQGTEDTSPGVIEGKMDSEIAENYNSTDIISLPSDDDIYYRSRGGMMRMLTGGGREIKRRTMRTKHDDDSRLLTRTQSARFDGDKTLQILRNQKIQEKLARHSIDRRSVI